MKIEIRGPRQPSYSLLIMGEHDRALITAEQVLMDGAKLSQVFFYGEAVKLAGVNQSQSLLVQRWLALKQQYHLTLWLCHEAALDWDVVDEHSHANMTADFTLGSLGQFSEGCYRSDYLLSFGVQDD